MAETQFELTYGTEARKFKITNEQLSGPVIAPREIAPLAGTVKEVIKDSLAHPIDRPSLRELAQGKRVGVIISDEFRAGLQREILDVLLDEIIMGSPASVTVLCATGTHDPKVYAKNAKMWTQEAENRLGMKIDFVGHHSENSDSSDLGSTSRGTLVSINTRLIDCNLRVYGHESKHHYLNGYSCIDKQILPGLSSGRTVAQNHKWALHPDSGPGRNPWHPSENRKSNPFAEDIRETRQRSERFMLSPSGKAVLGDITTFGLDMISEGQNVFWVRSGNPQAIIPEMMPVADGLMAFTVKRSKYVIISPGGPPASQALYGTQNCFDLALKGAITQGGEALVVAPLNGRPDLPKDVSGLAPDQRSKELFWDNLVKLLPLPIEESRKWIADNFELYLWKTDRVLRLLREDQVKVYLHSELPGELVRPGGFEAAPSIQEWIDERARRNDGSFTVINQGNKLCVWGQ